MKTAGVARVLAAGLLAWTAGSLVSAQELVYTSPGKLVISGKAPANAAGTFYAGVNYPWHSYGNDFGGYQGVSESKAAVNSDFKFLSSKGVKTVRWFLFCEGHAGLNYGKNGLVTGVTPRFYDDLKAALAIAKANDIRLVLVFFNYLMLDDPKADDKGVQIGGHPEFISDPRPRTAFSPMPWSRS